MRSRVIEAGFSLVELLIAMVVTLIISGSIVGLLITGQRTFQQQPEQSDRQQNVRAAMNAIMTDVSMAGSGTSLYSQVFTINDGVGSLNGMGPMGAGGVNTDELEILTNSGGGNTEVVCGNPGGSHLIRLARKGAGIPEGAVIVIVMEDGTWTVRQVTNVTTNNANDCNNPKAWDNCPAECGTAGGGGSAPTSDQLSANHGLGPEYNPSGDLCTPSPSGIGTVHGQTQANCVPRYLVTMDVIRYRIRPDAVDGVPNLERRSVMAGPNYEVVARGIEDMQVRYRAAGAGAGFADSPTAVAAGNPATVTVEVEVFLSSRSELAMLNGAGRHAVSSTGVLQAGDDVRIRGSLVSRGTPRAVLYGLAVDRTATTAGLWE